MNKKERKIKAKELLRLIDLNITASKRITIHDHDYIDTCDIYKILQKIDKLI